MDESFYIEGSLDLTALTLLRYKYGNLSLQEAYSQILMCTLENFKDIKMDDDYEPLIGDDQGLDYLGSDFTGP